MCQLAASAVSYVGPKLAAPAETCLHPDLSAASVSSCFGSIWICLRVLFRIESLLLKLPSTSCHPSVFHITLVAGGGSVAFLQRVQLNAVVFSELFPLVMVGP